MRTKKSIAPVVATALLIVVAVVAVIGFQDFFNTFQTGLNTKTESQSIVNFNTGIDTLIGSTLYFKNGGTQNITINSIKVGNNNCNLSGNYPPGMINITIPDLCFVNLSSSYSDIVVITKNKIYSKNLKVIRKSLGSFFNSLNSDFNLGTLSNVIVASNKISLALVPISAGTGVLGDYVCSGSCSLAGGTYNYRNFAITSGSTLTVSTNVALIILATEKISINGTINAIGKGSGGGAGGLINYGQGGNGYGIGKGFSKYNWPGSGGGFGGLGSGPAVPFAGGSISYGNDILSSILIGSGGAGGSGGINSPGREGGAGGAGGGGIYLTSAISIDFFGSILNANGLSGNNAGINTGAGSGGAGSGGAIYLKSKDITVSGTSLYANGATGGATFNGIWYYAGSGGGGRIYINTQTLTGSFIINVYPGTNPSYSGAIGSSRIDMVPSQYQSSAFFESQIFDVGSSAIFTDLSYTITTPALTSITIDVRSGNTPIPDGSWILWQTGISNGGLINIANGRYIQYRVNLGTTDTSVTPNLNDITINYYK